MKTVFLRLLEAEDKSAALLAVIREPDAARGKQRFDADPASFADVPRSPFAYWVSERQLALFARLPPFGSNGRSAKLGLKTDDDFQFVRLWFETDPSSRSWVLLAKGGVFSPFYSDVHCTLNWRDKGWALKSLSVERWGNAGKRIFNEAFFFRPGLTWPLRTSSGLSLRAMPAGCIFSHKGPAAFVLNDQSLDLLSLLAITTSGAYSAVTELQLAAADAAARSYEVGVMQRTPVPHYTAADQHSLATLAHAAWSFNRSLDTRIDTSHAFTLPALLQVGGTTLVERNAAWAKQVSTTEAKLAAIQTEIDTGAAPMEREVSASFDPSKLRDRRRVGRRSVSIA